MSDLQEIMDKLRAAKRKDAERIAALETELAEAQSRVIGLERELMEANLRIEDAVKQGLIDIDELRARHARIKELEARQVKTIELWQKIEAGTYATAGLSHTTDDWQAFERWMLALLATPREEGGDE